MRDRQQKYVSVRLYVQQSAQRNGASQTLKSDPGCLAAAWAAGPPWGCCDVVGSGAASRISPPRQLVSVMLPNLGRIGGGPGHPVWLLHPRRAHSRVGAKGRLFSRAEFT